MMDDLELKVKEIIRTSNRVRELTKSEGWIDIKNLFEKHIESLRTKLETCKQDELIELQSKIYACKLLLGIVNELSSMKDILEKEGITQT